MASEQPEEPAPAATIADFETEPDEPRRLSTVGRYVILDSIGMGGMGLVCAAYDPKLDRKIALKLLRSSSSGEASTAGRNRLFREAQALARLSHPNVVTVHDVDVYEGQVYIAMEFVEGTTLREWVRDGQRGWEEILAKFIPAGVGLAAAHAADIIHRDFKPANVLLSNEGDVRVADFGVAKEHVKGERAERLELEAFRNRTPITEVADPTGEDALISEMQSNASRELTVAGRMVGTPAYMAPEQHMGLRVGPFTDQYSFCVSLYEALYGRLPFEGTDRREQLTKMTEGRLPQPPKEGPGRHVPNWVHKILARGLNPHPSERWPSMQVLLSALQRDPARRLRRAALAAVGVIGVTVGVLGVVFGGQQAEVPIDVCEGVGAKVHERWTPERRGAVQAAFARSSKPFAEDAAGRVIQTFDRWVEGWEQQSVEICRGAQIMGEQNPRLVEARMSCLDQDLQDFEALVELFAEADDDIVERSVGAAHGLSNPAACATILRTSEEVDLDESVRVAVSEMDSDLARATARAALGKFEESLPLRESVLARAREHEHEPTLVRALYDLAESQAETGDAKAAEESLREGILLAAKLDDAEQEARLWARMIHYVGRKQSRPVEGKAWALSARGALARAGDPPKLTVRFESAMGGLLHGDGKYEEALEYYLRGLERAETTFGADNELTLVLMVNVGTAQGSLGRYEKSAETLELAAKRSRNFYGPAHPKVAAVYSNLGTVLSFSNETEEAEEALRTALEIREKVYGADSPRAVPIYLTLANIALDEGRAEDALAASERVVAILLASEDETSVKYAIALTNVGRAQAELGAYEQAREAYGRALEVYDALYSDPHPKRANLNRRRCELFGIEESWATAAEVCELALSEAREVSSSLDKDFEPDVLEVLIAVERGRGRPQASERYRQRLEGLRVAGEAGRDSEDGEDGEDAPASPN